MLLGSDPGSFLGKSAAGRYLEAWAAEDIAPSARRVARYW